jgi:hypothetical protein
MNQNGALMIKTTRSAIPVERDRVVRAVPISYS